MRRFFTFPKSCGIHLVNTVVILVAHFIYRALQTIHIAAYKYKGLKNFRVTSAACALACFEACVLRLLAAVFAASLVSAAALAPWMALFAFITREPLETYVLPLLHNTILLFLFRLLFYFGLLLLAKWCLNP